MLRYLRLASVQLRISAAAGMAYRADFILEGVMAIAWMALTLLPLIVLYGERQSVAGWDWPMRYPTAIANPRIDPAPLELHNIRGLVGNYLPAEIFLSLTVLSMLSAINAYHLMATRVLFAISRDGLFAKKAAEVNQGGTPAFALLISAAVAVLFIVVGRTFDKVIGALADVVTTECASDHGSRSGTSRSNSVQTELLSPKPSDSAESMAASCGVGR